MPVRWGIVGCGDVATKKAGPSFRAVEGAEIVAVADHVKERATAFTNATWEHDMDNASNFLLRFENGALGMGAYN